MSEAHLALTVLASVIAGTSIVTLGRPTVIPGVVAEPRCRSCEAADIMCNGVCQPCWVEIQWEIHCALNPYLALEVSQ